jgi:hypothetical protein
MPESKEVLSREEEEIQTILDRIINIRRIMAVQKRLLDENMKKLSDLLTKV